MYLPPLQPVANSDIRICGDVDIHPTASIAPGVILQAAPNSQIIIGIDACIGMGVIISAYGGVVSIDHGATLGSGVLIIGSSQIGSNACIGTASTIFNSSVDAMAVIKPGTILGDVSRSDITTDKLREKSQNSSNSKSQEKTTQLNEALEPSTYNQNHHQKEVLKKPIEPVSQQSKAKKQEFENVYEENDPSDPWSEQKPENTNLVKADIEVSKEIEKKKKSDDSNTIGKVYIDQLLVTLFPHKKK